MQTEEAKHLLLELYGIETVQIEQLVGYGNKNFKITSPQGMFVFKTHAPDQEAQVLAECEAMRAAAEKMPDESIPKPIKNLLGQWASLRQTSDGPKIVRLLTYIHGNLLAGQQMNMALAESLGGFLGKLDKSLESYAAKAIGLPRSPWDLDNFLANEALLDHIEDTETKKYCRYFFLHHKENVLPVLASLPKTLIHSDANEHNLIAENDKITGIIDFGDMCFSSRINETAIALAYALCLLPDGGDKLATASALLSGYARQILLTATEAKSLYWLVGARLATSVCMADFSSKQNPGNAYISISQKPVRKLLKEWVAMNPIAAEDAFLHALGLPPVPKTILEDALSARGRLVSKAMSLSFSVPAQMERASFQYMFDLQGNSFLDAYNNIMQVGHCHPRVVEAGQRQMAKLNTNTRYLYDVLHVYAEKLLSHFPTSLNRVFFVNSGSAAGDLALRLAAAFTGSKNVLSVEHGYHGNTQSLIDVSHYKFNGKGGKGQAQHVLALPMPDAYKGFFTGKGETVGKNYAEQAAGLIKAGGQKYGLFVAEPVVGCGGQVPLADGYLKTLYPIVRAQGGLCASDEVQVGFGRLGTHFWGFEQQGVTPDMVILGKPIANGHPMGAVVCSAEIADAFANGMEFFSSFGGNPVSCAIGLSVLEVLEEEGLQANANAVGNVLLQGFESLKNRFPQIGDVRGSGLFLGVEMVKDPLSKTADRLLAQKLKNALREKFIITGTDGPDDNVMKIKPPLCFSSENAGRLLEECGAVLSGVI